MGGKRKHGKMNRIPLGKTEKKLLDFIQELSQKLNRQEFSYQDLREGSWDSSKKHTYFLIRRLGKKGLLRRPEKGKFAITFRPPAETRGEKALEKILGGETLKKEGEEVPALEVKEYTSLIDNRIRGLSEDKKELEKNLMAVNANIRRWEKIREKLIQNPELVEVLKELKKLE
jgi:hypothetical protein